MDENKELEKAKALLKKVAIYMRGQALGRGEYVRQLDGTTKWELIPTLAGELYKELSEYR